MPPPPGARLRLLRAREDRVVGGVAAGLGRWLGVDPMLVRIAFFVLAFAGGVGIVAYAVLWATVPAETDAPPPARRPATTQQGVALALITLGVLLALRGIGLWFGDAVVLPVVLAAAGSAVVWTRGDARTRARLNAATPRLPDVADGAISPVRIAVGVGLVAMAMAGFLAANDALDALWELGLALVAAVAGVGLLFGPWLYRLVQQLGAERRERIRQEERAELAAHLHDSVLQTLALIQRAGDDPARMVGIARRQERELRAWLYGDRIAAGTAGLDAALRALADEVEATHAVNVDVVVVGDAEPDDAVRALLAAVREACVNAVIHAGVDVVDVYVEAEGATLTAFVRDRGRGFDPARVPDDRQGLRHSIIGRVERYGGSVTVSSSPGTGTEVELSVPATVRPSPPVAGPDPRPEAVR
jgi:signal transduction histidine kinase/phage shock protein PspC (stress-responsive transcriptional regulator)